MSLLARRTAIQRVRHWAPVFKVLALLWLVLALAAPWAMGWHMTWQLRAFDADNSQRLLQLFRLNRDTGLIPLIFFVLAMFV